MKPAWLIFSTTLLFACTPQDEVARDDAATQPDTSTVDAPAVDAREGDAGRVDAIVDPLPDVPRVDAIVDPLPDVPRVDAIVDPPPDVPRVDAIVDPPPDVPRVDASAPNCGSASCAASEVCVRERTLGGVFIPVPDSGMCPEGRHPEGDACVNDFTYRCASRPSCPTADCVCYASLCRASFMCRGVTATELTCEQLAP